MITKIIFKISGMHCVSCAMNIDGELEDTDGVKSSNTNYAKAITEVTFDSDKVTPNKLSSVIQQVGYTATPSA